MNVDIEVTNTECKILTKLNIDQLSIIQSVCKFKVQNSEYISGSLRNKYKWDGYRKLFNIQTRRFPIGLLARVRKCLIQYGYNVHLVINRNIIDKTYKFDISNEFALREYQTQAITTSLCCGNGILKIATGGGKTAIAGYTIGQLGKKTIFIVHTRDLLYQAKETFERIYPNEVIGQIGDGIIDYQNITVATMQTLAILGKLNNYERNTYDEDSVDNETIIDTKLQDIEKFHKYADTIQCVMMDEVQIVSSQTAYNVRFLFNNANYAFGYSASPWRDDGSDLMIEAAFGERIIDITASELIRKGYLIRPIIEIHNTSYILSDKLMKYVEVYKKYIVENQVRNLQVANDAIMELEHGLNTLILVTQINHGNILSQLINTMGYNAIFISGKSGMKKRKQAIEDMRNGKISLMIATSIADVGLDIPRLSCIIEAGAGKSSVTALQRLGRIMRLYENKDMCKFISYRDTAPFVCKHIKNKLQIWSTEPEFIIDDDLAAGHK